MAALVTLDQAKEQLSIPLTTTDRDAHIQDLVNRASAIVITHLKSRADPLWSAEDPLPVNGVAVPGGVQTGTLELIAQLEVHRGDEAAIEGDWKDQLIPHRDPTLA
jgi:hypothetical protein